MYTDHKARTTVGELFHWDKLQEWMKHHFGTEQIKIASPDLKHILGFLKHIPSTDILFGSQNPNLIIWL